MNIFRLDNDPAISAKMHVDKHVNKMIVEQTQIMHTALRSNGIDLSWMYKSYNKNHPSCLWARKSKQNMNWLFLHSLALLEEYEKRYEKKHACLSKILPVKDFLELFPDIGETEFSLAMPDKFKSDDPVHSYRLYYAAEKYYFAKWKYPAEQPFWWESYRQFVVENSLQKEKVLKKTTI